MVMTQVELTEALMPRRPSIPELAPNRSSRSPMKRRWWSAPSGVRRLLRQELGPGAD